MVILSLSGSLKIKGEFANLTAEATIQSAGREKLGLFQPSKPGHKPVLMMKGQVNVHKDFSFLSNPL